MDKVDPFDLVEPLPKSNTEKPLTFKEISGIIDKHMKEVEHWPPSIWGFTRDDFIESLEDLKEKVKHKCHS